MRNEVETDCEKTRTAREWSPASPASTRQPLSLATPSPLSDWCSVRKRRWNRFRIAATRTGSRRQSPPPPACVLGRSFACQTALMPTSAMLLHGTAGRTGISSSEPCVHSHPAPVRQCPPHLRDCRGLVGNPCWQTTTSNCSPSPSGRALGPHATLFSGFGLETILMPVFALGLPGFVCARCHRRRAFCQQRLQVR
jgi:hypothetical protein